MPSPPLIIFAAVITAAACALQSMVGFGAGLFAIPLLVWSGLSLPDAITVSVISTGGQMIVGAWRSRHDIPWRPIMPLVIYRFATLPIGVALLGVIVMVGRDAVQQAVGLGLLMVVGLIIAIRVTPRPRVHRGWSAAAGLSSGLLSGLLGMGGPPIVLWTLAHDWTPNRARAAIWMTNVLSLPAVMGLLIWQFGWTILDAAVIGLICSPGMLVGTTLGLHLGRHLCKVRLRRLSLALLLLIATSAIASPLLHRTAEPARAATVDQAKPQP